MFEWMMAKELGYEPQTTFYSDFSIADRFGANAVKDTFKRAFNEWKENHIYLTELVMVTNHKIWEYYKTNEPLARVYEALWSKASQYAETHLKGDELRYYYMITD